ncbi:hypothetical protein SDC9_67354 [bioreactor metagenome]|uniref:Uncharacterized protein n=1 Tax=bioreactor metagenome TaxID=1076179 RepID=A0A644XXC5_9ZZZZ|nr:hypothetical protein [Paludibacter sp.]
MKKIFAIIFLFIFCCCNGYNKDINKKLDLLKDIDYSQFSNMSIVKRGAYEYVKYNKIEYKIKRNFLTKKITSIKDVSIIEEKDVSLSKSKDFIKRIEATLKSFDKLKILALSVDDKDNVLLSIPWYEKCTYYFQKLSPATTLQELNATHYKHYCDTWYIDKRCSE